MRFSLLALCIYICSKATSEAFTISPIRVHSSHDFTLTKRRFYSSVRASAASGKYDISSPPPTPTQMTPSPPIEMQRAMVTIILVLLVMQNAGASLLTGAVRKRCEYDGASVALVSEMVKIPIIFGCFALLKNKTAETWDSLRRNFCSRSGLELSIPSACFALQNILYFTALRHLDAATYTVLSQSKTAFTALFFVTILGRSLSKMQLFAILSLMIGMGLVQVCGSGCVSFETVGTSAMAIGSFAVLLSSITSAFANIVFEKIAKTESGSLYAKQLQLGFWTSCFTVFEVLRRNGRAGLRWNFLTGSWTLGVWGIVLLKSLGGLLVAGSITFADNIVKTFSTALAIILTVLATRNSATPRGMPFVAGSSLVLLSIFLYALGGKKTNK